MCIFTLSSVFVNLLTIWLSLKLIQNNKYILLAVRQDVYNPKSKMQINRAKEIKHKRLYTV